MRCFIALEIPGAVKNHLVDLQESLKKTQADVRWVPEENLHLTLRFLGEIDEPQVQLVKQDLDQAVAGMPRFEIRLAGAGAFPGVTSPKVVWAGVETGKETLNQIAQAVKALENFPVQPGNDMPFSPHITLGRVRSRKFRQNLVSALQKIQWRCDIPWEVNEVGLYLSELTPSGAVYSRLHRSPLSG